MKRYILLISLGSLTGLFLLFFLLTSEALAGFFHPLIAVIAALIGSVMAFGVYGLSQQLDRLLPWNQYPGWRWLLGFLTNTVLVYSLSYLGLRLAGFWLPELLLSFEAAPDLFLKLGIVVLLLVLIYTALYFALYSYQYYGQQALVDIQQKREQIDLQWAALRNQLQPHFLFNSLNTISALIYRDKQQAETFIRRLADTYRYPLNSYDRPLVKLGEELNFVAAYFYLLQTRFGNNLELVVDVPESCKNNELPPLSIQLLIENAVKHNTINDDIPLTINVLANDDYLWVKNNITEAPDAVDSFSIGLSNIGARYRLLAKREIEVKKGEEFSVKIPLLR